MLTNEHLKILANASRHGLSHVAPNAPSQYLLNVVLSIVEVEKKLEEEQKSIAIQNSEDRA